MKKSGRQRQTRLKDGNIPPTALQYTGPLVPYAFKQENEVRTEVMRLDTEVVATAGGVAANVVGSNPASFSNWSQFGATYDEYRVLSMVLHFEPYQRYHDAALNQSPMYVVTDRADATALTSYQNALEYSSCTCYNTADRWNKSIKMNGSEDAAWIPVSTGYSALYVKVYAAILTASTAIGRFNTTLLVQFRGTK